MQKHRECPECGLVNASSARRCDCGYDFHTGKALPASRKLEKGSRGSGRAGKVFVVGGLVMLAVAGANAGQAPNVPYLVGTFMPGLLVLNLGLWLQGRGTKG